MGWKRRFHDAETTIRNRACKVPEIGSFPKRKATAWPGSRSSRLTTPDVDPKAAALLLAAENAQDVPVLNVHRALANHPDVMEAFMRLAEIVYFDNGLNPVQSELAYYTSAVTNSCFY